MSEGYAFEDLATGMSASFSRTVTEADIVNFAGVSGDFNPVHMDEEFAAGTVFKGRIAHGMLSGAFISTLLGTRMPGPGSIYVSQSMRFRAPVRIGDTVTIQAEVKELNADKRFVTMDTRCLVKGKPVVTGEAVMMVPARS